MDRYMTLAWREAEASAKTGGVRSGAVMVVDGEVLVRARDRTATTNHYQPLAHATMEAFRHASLRNDFGQVILVTTHAPCWMCAGIILQFKIHRVVCGVGAQDEKQKQAVEHLVASGVQVDFLTVPEYAKTPGGCPAADGSTHQTLKSLGGSEKALDIAYENAKKSYNEGGIPVGASVVVGDEVIACGHNQSIHDGNPASHGETQCFTNAGGNVEWGKSTLYTTLSPCMMCTGSVLHLGIPKVVIGENKTFGGNEELLRKHGVEVEVLEDCRCYDLMQKFIKEKPEIWNGDIGENGEK